MRKISIALTIINLAMTAGFIATGSEMWLVALIGAVAAFTLLQTTEGE